MTGKLGPYNLNTIVTGDAKVLAEAIPDESVDLVLTDPPYGIDLKYPNGYKDDPTTYHDVLKWVIAESNRALKPGGLAFVYQAMKRLRETWLWFPKDSRIFVSAKNFTQLNREEITHAYEPVVFWKKPGASIWRKMIKDFHVANAANTRNKGLQDGANEIVPCPRHIETIMYIVNEACPPSGVVIDFFMGSGTTALACKVTGRNYWGCEIDPDTAALARERVAQTQPPLPLVMPEQLGLLE